MDINHNENIQMPQTFAHLEMIHKKTSNPCRNSCIVIRCSFTMSPIFSLSWQFPQNVDLNNFNIYFNHNLWKFTQKKVNDCRAAQSWSEVCSLCELTEQGVGVNHPLLKGGNPLISQLPPVSSPDTCPSGYVSLSPSLCLSAVPS